MTIGSAVRAQEADSTVTLQKSSWGMQKQVSRLITFQTFIWIRESGIITIFQMAPDVLVPLAYIWILTVI